MDRSLLIKEDRQICVREKLLPMVDEDDSERSPRIRREEEEENP